jgi:hypothetical protein
MLKMFKLICSIISTVFLLILGIMFLSILLVISLVMEIIALITNRKEDDYDKTE